jgi:hypothetical protein
MKEKADRRNTDNDGENLKKRKTETESSYDFHGLDFIKFYFDLIL